MFEIPKVAYLYFLYLIIFLLPISLSIDARDHSGTVIWLIVEAVSISVFVLTDRRTKSKGLTLHYGLLEICESKVSGCANISLLYMVPLLLVAYLLAVLSALAGLFKGQNYSQERWIAIVAKLGHGVQYGPIVAAVSAEIEKSPNSVELYFRRAREYEKCGQTELALADYNKVLSLQPRNIEVLLRKGGLCEELGKRQEAIVAYRAFLYYAPAEDKERLGLVREWLSGLGGSEV